MVAFLFDNDGVLIDSTECHWLAWDLLSHEQSDFQPTRKEFEGTFGMRNDMIIHKIAPHLGPEIRKELGERKEALFRQVAQGKIELIEGMEPFLLQCKQADIPRIIASSTPVENLEMYLKSTILGNYFDHFVSAEEVEHGKPFPDVFLEGARRLNTPPEQCIVFEDAPAGIEAGKTAGCFVVGLATTHPQKELVQADLVIEDPQHLDLQEILQKSSLGQ